MKSRSAIALVAVAFVVLFGPRVNAAAGDQTKARKYFKTNVTPALKKHDDEQIEAALKKCLEIYPRYYRALCALGLYEFGKEDWSDAIDYLTRAQEVAPSKKVAAALQSLVSDARQCQAKDSTDIEKQKRQYAGHIFMARVFLQARQYSRSLAEANNAVSVDPTLWEGYVAQAAAYRGLKRFPDVRQNLQKAKELAPEEAKYRIQAALDKEAKL